MKTHNFYTSLSLLSPFINQKYSKTTNLIMQIIILAHNPPGP